MSKEWITRLRPFAEHLEAMYQAIVDASDDDLMALRRACGEPTQTNCGWSTYRVARVIFDEIDGEILRRKRAAHSANEGQS